MGSWHLDWRTMLVVFAIFVVGLFLGSRHDAPGPPVQGSASERLGRCLRQRTDTVLREPCMCRCIRASTLG